LHEQSIVRALAQRLPPVQRVALEAIAQGDDLLREPITSAALAWPGVHVSADQFLDHVATSLAAQDGVDARLLEMLRYEDLYLACACALHQARALGQFERHFMAHVPLFVSRIDPAPAFADDVCQRLRTRLFVDDDRSKRKILSYSGRGPLAGWLRVVAIRTAYSLKRSRKGDPHLPIDGERLADVPTNDPEFGYLKEHYRRPFREAFEKALAGQPARTRNVLCLYYLEQMTSKEIGNLYGVSGAAVRLWLKQARREILVQTRQHLAERLALQTAELDSVMFLAKSECDLTLSRLLKEDG
jgi:RNA polymerase sigma-70 factor (ECF subfamily)